MTNVAGLECAACGKTREAGRVHNLCECGGPLLVRYHLDAIRKQWNRDSLAGAPDSMWRYAPVLPASETSIVSLGEGMTPLVRASRLGAKLGANHLLINQFLYFHEIWQGPPVKRDKKRNTRLPTYLVHGFAFGGIQGHWLFDIGGFTGPHRPDGVIGMTIGGRGYVDGIHVRIID